MIKKNYFKSRVGLVVIGCIISLTFGANSVKADNPVPRTTSISPTTKVINSDQFNMFIDGNHFDEASVVKFNGAILTTRYYSSTELKATIPASYLTASGTNSITVFNTTPGGGTSRSQTFTVTDHLVPSTTSISPTTQVVNSDQFIMRVYGTGFDHASVVKFNGATMATTYLSSTEIACPIPASDLTAAGTFSITVTNPTPGGGDSNSQTFTVTQ